MRIANFENIEILCLLFSVYFIFHSGSNAGREKVSKYPFSSFHFSKIDTCARIERLGHSYWFWVMSNEVILSNENIKLNHSFPMHRFPNPWKHQKTLWGRESVHSGIHGLNENVTIIHYFTPIYHHKTSGFGKQSI